MEDNYTIDVNLNEDEQQEVHHTSTHSDTDSNSSSDSDDEHIRVDLNDDSAVPTSSTGKELIVGPRTVTVVGGFSINVSNSVLCYTDSKSSVLSPAEYFNILSSGNNPPIMGPEELVKNSGIRKHRLSIRGADEVSIKMDIKLTAKFGRLSAKKKDSKSGKNTIGGKAQEYVSSKFEVYGKFANADEGVNFIASYIIIANSVCDGLRISKKDLRGPVWSTGSSMLTAEEMASGRNKKATTHNLISMSEVNYEDVLFKGYIFCKRPGVDSNVTECPLYIIGEDGEEVQVPFSVVEGYKGRTTIIGRMSEFNEFNVSGNITQRIDFIIEKMIFLENHLLNTNIRTIANSNNTNIMKELTGLIGNMDDDMVEELVKLIGTINMHKAVVDKRDISRMTEAVKNKRVKPLNTRRD